MDCMIFYILCVYSGGCYTHLYQSGIVHCVENRSNWSKRCPFKPFKHQPGHFAPLILLLHDNFPGNLDSFGEKGHFLDAAEKGRCFLRVNIWKDTHSEWLKRGKMFFELLEIGKENERDVIMWQRYGNVFCATRWVLSSWLKLGVTRTNGWTNCLHLHLGLSENRLPHSIQWNLSCCRLKLTFWAYPLCAWC